ncbi:MAG: YchJ family metal-binding protein [Thiohalobacteraceae bacterium]
MTSRLCPCGSGRAYRECCEAALDGARPPATAEALMRSRFTAFVRGDADYLLASWHPATRPAQLQLDDQPRWERLEILHAQGGGADDTEGRVGFAAYYRSATGPGCLRELSRFHREQGRWYYLDGRPLEGDRPGRNAACPCGSGRKFKRCCGR